MTELQKNRVGIQESSPDFLPQAEDSPWGVIPPETMVLLRCSECGCINAGFEDNSHIQSVLESGYGMNENYCQKPNCNCHTGGKRLPKLLMKTKVI